MINDMEFFHQATIKICGSLDKNKMISDCAACLGTYIPLDSLILCNYDKEHEAIRILAHNNTSVLDAGPRTIPLSPKARKFMETADFQGTDIIRNADLSPVAREVIEALDVFVYSKMTLHLNMDKRKLGVVIILSSQPGVFTPEHARLIGLLHDPFAVALANVLQHRELIKIKDFLADDNQYLRHELFHLPGNEIIGAQYGLKSVMTEVARVAPLSTQVMLLGETGVGKEVIANAIHQASDRSDGPFIKVNCGAIPENLIDSELFGHEKGAFTGATEQKKGRFERAHHGTIFLDEIGELPPNAQVRLLRVIQNREIERVGGTKSIPLDIRIIAATHRDLEQMVAQGAFREDLWFRLFVFPIKIPPLRDRAGDIPDLVRHFIKKKAIEMKFTYIPAPTPDFMSALKNNPWKGNIRELENTVERALIRHMGMPGPTPLGLDDLAGEYMGNRVPDQSAAPLASLDAVMADHIKAVMTHTRGKIKGKSGAAAILGIHPSTLRSRMKKLGIPFGRSLKCQI